MKKVLMALAVFGLMVAPSMAAISYVTGSGIGSGVDSDSGSLTHASFAAGSGNYVVVSVSMKTQNNTVDTPVTGVTYGGSSMVYIGLSHVTDGGGWDVYTYLYGVASSSASGDVVASWLVDNSASDFDAVSVAATSWSGATGYTTVSPGTIDGDPTQDGDTLTDSITTTGTDSMIVAAFGWGSALTGTSSSTSTIQVQEDSSTFNNNSILSQAAAIAGDYDSSFSYTGGNPRRASAISVELVPEPATVGMLGLGALVAILVRRIRA